MSTRISRFEFLRKKGLFQGEAKELSKFEFTDVPYFKGYIRERRKVLNQWLKWKKQHGIPEGQGRRKYFAMVKKWYVDRGWVNDKGQIDVWKAWRHYEDNWKDKHDDYKKPSKKKQSDILITERKLRNSLGW